MKTLERRVEALERQVADLEPVEPGLVLLHDAKGYRVDGQTYPTVEAAKAAYPERTLATIIVAVVDSTRRPNINPGEDRAVED